MILSTAIGVLVGSVSGFMGRGSGAVLMLSGRCTDEPPDLPDHDRYECLSETGTSEYRPDHRIPDLDEHCQNCPR